MTAEVTRFAVREATPDSIRALVRTTISGIEKSFNTVDRLQPRTRLALALSLLEGGPGKPSVLKGRQPPLRPNWRSSASTTAIIG
jgi:adenine-specific DNA-methyltransferase